MSTARGKQIDDWLTKNNAKLQAAEGLAASLTIALDALTWTTGSADFGEDGRAYVGAQKVLYPSMHTASEALAAWNEANQ